MNPSVRDIKVPVVDVGRYARTQALVGFSAVLVCCLLITLGAFVRVPVPGTDVPMTLQLLAVLVTGYLLTPRRAAAAALLYVGCGAAGLPVFASMAGLAGPTAGYLVGFVVAAWLVSAVEAGHEAGVARRLTAGLCGVLTVFALGVGWRLVLARVAGLSGGDMGLAAATGVMPFAVKTVVELLLAVRLAGSLRRMMPAKTDGG